MHVYAVIPVHNRRDLTRGCLESLRAQTWRELTTIVVDDGSMDGTSEMIAKEFPGVVLLRGDGNLWWTGAINEGIRHALEVCVAEDYVLIQNDDLLLPPDYVEKLVETARRMPDALVGSVVTDVNDRDTIHGGGIRINWWTAKWRNLHAGARLSSFPKGHVEEASTLTGRGTLIPSRVFREIGLYSAKYFPKQHGDLELPVRARKAGYRLVVSYDAVVWSYTRGKDSRHVNETTTYRLSDLRRYLFGIHANTNLRDRFALAWPCRKNVLQFVIYFLFDLARISVHFLRGLRFGSDPRNERSSAR